MDDTILNINDLDMDWIVSRAALTYVAFTESSELQDAFGLGARCAIRSLMVSLNHYDDFVREVAKHEDKIL